jgi:hypothetical protein
MLLRRVGTGIGIMVVGTAMALVPAVASGASKHEALCSLNKNVSKAEAKSSGQISSAIESGRWSAAQKALLASFNQYSQAEAAAMSALSNSPANVRAAGSVLIKFAGTEKSIIEKSTSASQFESSEEAAAQSPKVASAEKILAAYFGNKCGSGL